MKKYLMLSLLLTIIIPTVMMEFLQISEKENEGLVQDDVHTTENHPILLLLDEQAVTIDLEEYVMGVVLAEMPMDFEMDALKAQAVAARTFACKRRLNSKHQNADVCNNPSCCQAYMSPEEYKKLGGKEDDLNKAKESAQKTAGQVAVYMDELIEATYFSCSGGQTESAAAVWGAEVPYLQSVPSPGEEHAVRFTESVTMSLDRFLGCINLSDEMINDVSVISLTDGGGVDQIKIGNRVYSGTELRRLLNLRSTVFEIVIHNQTVEINTKGFGHRVGMSQYGADAMAVQGADYIAILQHYYKDVEIVHMNEYGADLNH